jgi:hypothetical protein
VNPRLSGYMDEKNINARRESEFISKILQEADHMMIKVEMTLNWGIWNNKRISLAYPDACLQQDRAGKPLASLHCPDSPGAWQLGLDEVVDLLSYYDGSPALTRFAFERISYIGKGGCYCANTEKAYTNQHSLFSNHVHAPVRGAQSYRTLPEADLVHWKAENIGRKITEYTRFIKARFPRIEVGCSTVGNKHWGHDPRKFHEWGLDYIQPHTIQHETGKHDLYRAWKHISPNPMLLHFDLRDRAPYNYAIWPKTPRIIHKVLTWVKDAPVSNIDGIIFFNEPVITARNRGAMYDDLDALFQIGD